MISPFQKNFLNRSILNFNFVPSTFQVLDCFEVEGESPVKFSSETLFVTDKYEIV